MHILGADHTSFAVASLERSLAFYHGLLGLELLWQRDVTSDYFRRIVGFPNAVARGAQLRIPGTTHKLELFEYVIPLGLPADVLPNNPGSAHLALRVADLPAAYAELQAQGVEFRSPPVQIDSGPNRGAYAVYLLDPDGITVELIQSPPLSI